MNRRFLLGIAAVLGLTVWSKGAIVINFDDLTSSTNGVEGTSVPADSRLSNQYLSSDGIVFSSAAPYVAVSTVGAAAATSGTHAISPVISSGTVEYQHGIAFTFWDPANPTTPSTTNFFSMRGDRDATGGGYSIPVNAFDLNNNLIATDTEIDSGGETWSFNMSGIHKIFFPGTPGDPYNGGIALDDVTFNPVAVPEPSAAILAIGITGCFVRRRRSETK